MAEQRLAHAQGRTDENGALLIVSAAAGTAGPLDLFPHLSVAIGAGSYLTIAEKTEGALDATEQPFGTTKGRVDENEALQVGLVAVGSTPGPLTPLGNLLVKTDVNGYLICASQAAGSTLGPITPLMNLKCRTDENGAVIIATGP